MFCTGENHRLGCQPLRFGWIAHYNDINSDVGIISAVLTLHKDVCWCSYPQHTGSRHQLPVEKREENREYSHCTAKTSCCLGCADLLAVWGTLTQIFTDLTTVVCCSMDHFIIIPVSVWCVWSNATQCKVKATFRTIYGNSLFGWPAHREFRVYNI